MPMFTHASADHAPIGGVERREKRSGSVAFVIMSHGLTATLFYRQTGLGAIEGLNLTLLIAAQDNGVLRRRKVESHDIFELLGKVSVVGELEGFRPMWFQPMGCPDSTDARGAHANFTRHRLSAPVGGSARFTVEGQFHDARSARWRHRGHTAGTSFVFENPGESPTRVALPPSAHLCICLLYTSPSPRDRQKS